VACDLVRTKGFDGVGYRVELGPVEGCRRHHRSHEEESKMSRRREEINWGGVCPSCPLSKAGQPELCRLPRSSRESWEAEGDCRQRQFYGRNAAQQNWQQERVEPRKKDEEKELAMYCAQYCGQMICTRRCTKDFKINCRRSEVSSHSAPRAPRDPYLAVGSPDRLSEHREMLRSSPSSPEPLGAQSLRAS
jgi:hypothetical protein